MSLCSRETLPLVVGLLAATVAALLLAPGITAGASASPCGKWGNTGPSHLNDYRAGRAVECLINEKRHNNGHRGLHSNDRLHHAANKHSHTMRRRGCFDHQCNGEGALETRLWKADYLQSGLSRWAFGENIAWGAGDNATPRRIVDAWMASPGHRANILSSQFRDFGVGFAKGTPYRRHGNGGMYTLDFGMRAG